MSEDIIADSIANITEEFKKINERLDRYEKFLMQYTKGMTIEKLAKLALEFAALLLPEELKDEAV